MAFLDRLDDLRDRMIAVDGVDGDPDLEPGAEDEGAQCDDEGAYDDREADTDNEPGDPIMGAA